jgi:hypothetical protein
MRATLWFLGASGSAIFFTTLIGICSKCVWDFRLAVFDLAIDERYRSAGYTGDLFWEPDWFVSLDSQARLAGFVPDVLEMGRARWRRLLCLIRRMYTDEHR